MAGQHDASRKAVDSRSGHCKYARVRACPSSLSPSVMTDGVKPLLQSQGSHTRYDMAPNTEGQKRKKVLVVGAGAAGTYRAVQTMME